MAAVIVVLALPSAAMAQEPTTCDRVEGAAHSETDRVVSGLNVVTRDDRDAVAAPLGDQFAGLWVQSALGTWWVGLAPGPLNEQEARAKLREKLHSVLDDTEAEYMHDRLRVLAQPYSNVELRRIQDEIVAAEMGSGRPNMVVGLGSMCKDGAMRVGVMLNTEGATEEQAAEVEHRLRERYGDRVRFERTGPIVANSTLPAAPPRFSDLVSIRRLSGCRLRLRARGDVINLAVGRRDGRRRLTVPVRRRMQVTVRLRDGRAITKVLRFKRCSAA